MQKRNILNSPKLLELKKKRQKNFLVKILLSIFALSLIFVCLAYLSRISALNIGEIKVTSNKAVDTDMIKMAVEKKIAGNYLWFFPKTNILFYPKNSIKRDLFNQFKRLNNIALSIKNNKLLEISLTERTALYTWCGNTIDLVVGVPSDKKCYFMDKDGFIFDEAPYFSGEVYFKFYGLASIGTYFSENNFKQLIYFKDTLVAMKFKPFSLSIEDNGNIKIFLSNLNKTTIEPYLILKVDSDFQNVAENLEAAMSTEPLQSNFKNKYSSLQYIDLRFGNKIVYKFK